MNTCSPASLATGSGQMARPSKATLAALLTLGALSFGSAPAQAEDGFRTETALGVRATPVGLNLMSDIGFRRMLPGSDSESVLRKNTYIDGGTAIGLSPAFAWGGLYVEALPLAVLQLRASAQYVQYFGNFGFLYVPETTAEGSADWSKDALKASADQDGGTAAGGFMFEGRVTPRLRAGNLVFTAETRLTALRMSLEQNYYEPFFDMLFAPNELFWVTRPTLGYILGQNPKDSFLLLGARFERMQATEADVTRDTAGLIWMYKLPPRFHHLGQPTWSGFGGVFLDHPNRGTSPYFGTQLSVKFGQGA